jgi:hypothetical protein
MRINMIMPEYRTVQEQTAVGATFVDITVQSDSVTEMSVVLSMVTMAVAVVVMLVTILAFKSVMPGVSGRPIVSIFEPDS